MTRRTGKRKFHFKNVITTHPAVKSFGEWFPANQGFFANFRQWLSDGGYGFSSVHTYGAAARLALGLLDKPYWTVDPQADLQVVRDHLAGRSLTAETKRLYNNGLDKLVEYLCLRCHKPLPEPALNWDYYLNPLPAWLGELVRLYVQHCLRTCRPEDRHRARLRTVGPLTAVLRWMVVNGVVTSLESFTPDLWFAFVEAELVRDIEPVTLNIKLYRLQNFLLFLAEAGHPVCKRLLSVKLLPMRRRVPKDVPVEQVRQVWAVIQQTAESKHGLVRRFGLMDRAWCLLMLHSGLRSGEVRRLKLGDIEWTEKRVRLEQAKGLKDRLVPLSAATLVALQAYLAVRGPAEALPPNVFIHQHQRLGLRYFQIRLRNYGKIAGIKVTAHQLRHTCATMLLNAGAPILTVQAILGHKYVHTTLGYARLYDGTVAADYYRAMAEVEKRLPLIADAALLCQVEAQPNVGKLLALVDSLRGGTLNESQTETLHLLRAGLLALAESEGTMELLKSG
jgi:integrase